MFEIEKGLPIPDDEAAKDARRAKTYNFHALEVGDSILVPGENKSGRAYTAAYNYNARNPERELTSRTVEGGLRIWRVK